MSIKIIRIIENKKADHGYCEDSCKFLHTEEFHSAAFLFQKKILWCMFFTWVTFT